MSEQRLLSVRLGLPWWLRWSRICLQCRRRRFDPWVGMIPYRRKWQPTPVFFPGEFRGQRSLAAYTVHGVAELDMTEWLTLPHFSVSIFLFKLFLLKKFCFRLFIFKLKKLKYGWFTMLRCIAKWFSYIHMLHYIILIFFFRFFTERLFFSLL